MSGAVAAHAAYNGSGTQGLAVTNKIHDDDGDVISVFWNKNDTTRQLLYGSALIEIPASGNGGSLTAGGNQIFTVNNDIDALGDIYIQLTTTNFGTTAATTHLKGGIDGFGLLAAIKRVEIMVGTQVWQTLNTEDIGALNMTEMSPDLFESFALATSGGFSAESGRVGTRLDTTLDINNGGIEGGYQNVTAAFRVPGLSRTIGPKFSKFTDVSEQAYLLAGAPHQSVKIKVYMAASWEGLSSITFDMKMFGQAMVMCNEEREQIKAMPMGIPKRIKMTQNMKQAWTGTGAVTGTSTNFIQTVTLDLDHFSLYASHIIFYALCVDDRATAAETAPQVSIKSVELKLNSSSFSGELDGGLMTGATADSMGLYSNGLYFGGANVADNFYVFPLASLAYGGSSVPLNRFDNIRATVQLCTTATSVKGTISATCVGETTALYKGGAASLAMY